MPPCCPAWIYQKHALQRLRSGIIRRNRGFAKIQPRSQAAPSKANLPPVFRKRVRRSTHQHPQHRHLVNGEPSLMRCCGISSKTARMLPILTPSPTFSYSRLRPAQISKIDLAGGSVACMSTELARVRSRLHIGADHAKTTPRFLRFRAIQERALPGFLRRWPRELPQEHGLRSNSAMRHRGCIHRSAEVGARPQEAIKPRRAEDASHLAVAPGDPRLL